LVEYATSERADDPSLARLGAFSDGVFAFAVTLLVLTIRIPHPTDADASAGLLTLLTQQWKSFMAYVLTFMLMGINWANHRVMFSKFTRSSHALVWLNLLYLMVGVAFMPIPTAVLGDWIGNPQNRVVAAVFYGSAATVGGVLFNTLWWYGAYVGKLTTPQLTAHERRAHTIAWAPAPLFVAALTAVAFVSPVLAVTGFVVLIVLYVLPTPGLVALLQRRRPRKVNI
jgi:TMEM175 potassium channel family protein